MTRRFTLISIAGLSVLLALALSIQARVLAHPDPSSTVNMASENAAPTHEMPPGTGLQPSYKIAWPGFVQAGQAVTYTIKLINAEMITATATVTDPLPVDMNYVDGSASNGGAYDSGTRTLTWNSVTVTGHDRTALSFVVTASTAIVSPTWIMNTATISSSGQAFQRSAWVVVVPASFVPPHPILLGGYKVASRSFVKYGDVFTYTIHINNSGTADATVDVIDPVPASLNTISDTISPTGTYDAGTHLITWNDLMVPAGDSVPLTFAVTPAQPVTRPLPIVNTAMITDTGHRPLKFSSFVLQVPQVSGDFVPPRIHSLTIDDQDVLTSPTTTLHISATDNISVSQMFIREWALTPAPFPHWAVVQSSGWITYQLDYSWVLSSTSGTHFVGAWVADAAHNRSHIDRRSLDFASLLLPQSSVRAKGVVPYLVYYDANVSVTATLQSTSGDADLYLWHPGHYFWPDGKSTHPMSETDGITFTTPHAGIYRFLVYGATAATYDLSIAPSGGPRAWPDTDDTWHSPAGTNQTPSSAMYDAGALASIDAGSPGLTSDPVLPISGLDPLATDPQADALFAIYLPLLIR
jgi:uncharacterized repeat protein (TIGR01451 family)